MKRLFTPGSALVVVLTALATVPQQRAHGQGAGLVSSVIARMQRNHETLKTLRATISMEKYDARLREKIILWRCAPCRELLRTPSFVWNGANRNMRFSASLTEIHSIASG